MYSWRRPHLDWIRLWWWWWLPILVLGLIIEKTVTILIIVMMEALSQPCFTIAFYSWFLVGGLLFFVHVYAVQGLESFFLYWNLDFVDDWHLTSVIIDFFLSFFLIFFKEAMALCYLFLISSCAGKLDFLVFYQSVFSFCDFCLIFTWDLCFLLILLMVSVRKGTYTFCLMKWMLNFLIFAW